MSRVTVPAVLVALVVLAPLAAAAGTGAGVGTADATAAQANPCVGEITDQPERATVASIQGARGGDKTDAMLVSVTPSGEVLGVHNDADYGRWWAYDVDRLPNGNFLMSGTQDRHTVVEEIDAETGEHVSVREFEGLHDTHDVDLINGDELLMNDMGDEHNRVVAYNLTREDITWEYRFDDHTDVFPRSGGGEYGVDWTHNNDVEQIHPGVVMVSLKNFDQVVAVNRSTRTVEWTLGEDDDLDVLHKQHNPDYILTDDGRPTVVVADSRNDRVAEYTLEGGEWNLTWELVGGGLDEPRDADRLPNGNTLVVDRHGHRMVEATPDGEVRWEVSLPFQPYDAERLGTRDESSGPTMLDANATGTTELDSESVDTADLESCYDFLTGLDRSRLVPEDDPGVVTATPFSSGSGSNGLSESLGDSQEPPATDDGTFPTAVVAVLVVVLAAVVGGVVWRRRE